MKRRRRILPLFVGALNVFAASGALYQALAAAIDRRTYPPPGEMVSVGGRRLHLRVRGEESGSPTVILEAGMGFFSSNWVWVQEELSRTTQMVSYQPRRTGLERSRA